MQPFRIIKQALDTTIVLINRGDNPTAALKKTAQKLDLNPNYIQRTGEALNVALHYDHFKKASDKAADFPTANIEEVTKEIFKEKEKPIKQKEAEWFGTSSDVIDYNKYLTNTGFKKTASELLNEDVHNYDSYETSFKGQLKKASDYLQRLDKELDQIKTEKAANEVNVEAYFFNIVNDFKKEASTRESFHEFESRAFVELGERAMPYVDMVYKTANLKESRGTHDPKFLPREVPCVQFQKLATLLNIVDQKIKLAAELEEAEKHAKDQQQAYREMCYELNPLAKDAAARQYADDLLEFFEKQADSGSGGLIKELFKQFTDSSMNKDVKTPIFKNTGTDNRDRSHILQELIMTDPILSKQDPHKIIQAYQQLLRIAPHISKEKEIVRAELRSRLAGQAMHAVDANQLIDTNSNYLKQQQLLNQADSGTGTPGKR